MTDTNNVIEFPRESTPQERAWKKLDDAHAKTLDGYLDFCAACIEASAAGITQQQIAQRYEMDQAEVARAIAVGTDARFMISDHKSLPRSPQTLYLLTQLDDAGFAALAKRETTRDEVKTYIKANARAPAATPTAATSTTKKRGAPKKAKVTQQPKAKPAPVITVLGWSEALERHFGGKLPDGYSRDTLRDNGANKAKARLTARIRRKHHSFEIQSRVDENDPQTALIAAAIREEIDERNPQAAQHEIDAEVRAMPATARERHERTTQRQIALDNKALQQSFAEAVRAEALRIMPDQFKSEMDQMRASVQRAHDTESAWYRRASACQDLLSLFFAAYRTIAAALHPDRAPDDRREQFTRAMEAINTIKDAAEKARSKFE